MNRNLSRFLVQLYPRAWRERYGAEFEEFLRSGDGGFGAAMNVVRAAIFERMFPTRRLPAERNANSFGAMMRRPSAFMPVVMSLTAMLIVIGHIVIYGVTREADEGTPAHLWQILMAGQLPVLGFFVIKWLPRAPKQTLGVIALQAGAMAAAMAPVFIFNL